MSQQGSGDQLVIEHVVAAPRDRVWAALTEPDLLAQWFGPEGWSVDPATVHIDLRVDGLQSFSMHEDAFPSMVSSVTARFVEIVPTSRLVATETVYGASATDSLGLTLAIDLVEAPEGTRLTLQQGPFPDGVDDLARRGWVSSLGKLERLLAAG